MLGMLGDGKKMVTTIMGKLGGELPSPNTPETDSSPGLEAAMSKFISCVHAKDAKGCVSALGDFLEMYEMQEDQEPSSEAP